MTTTGSQSSRERVSGPPGSPWLEYEPGQRARTIRYGWCARVALACGAPSLAATAILSAVFLAGVRYEFAPPWMMVCVACQTLCLPGTALGGLFVALASHESRPQAKRPFMINLTGVAAAVLQWSLLALL